MTSFSPMQNLMHGYQKNIKQCGIFKLLNLSLITFIHSGIDKFLGHYLPYTHLKRTNAPNYFLFTSFVIIWIMSYTGVYTHIRMQTFLFYFYLKMSASDVTRTAMAFRANTYSFTNLWIVGFYLKSIKI
uniref:Uncharacterized protein n=1 Tax=Glossina brevipalpis TaxID=37001 RepID=A0A1A9WCK8_9MUSC